MTRQINITATQRQAEKIAVEIFRRKNISYTASEELDKHLIKYSGDFKHIPINDHCSRFTLVLESSSEIIEGIFKRREFSGDGDLFNMLFEFYRAQAAK